MPCPAAVVVHPEGKGEPTKAVKGVQGGGGGGERSGNAPPIQATAPASTTQHNKGGRGGWGGAGSERKRGREPTSPEEKGGGGLQQGQPAKPARLKGERGRDQPRHFMSSFHATTATAITAATAGYEDGLNWTD